MVRVLITEANDGLGLALVKEYLTDADNQVVSFCGDPTKRDRLNLFEDIFGKKRLLIVDVTLSDEDAIKASVEPIEIYVDALDLLIFNPGFIPDEFFVDEFSDLPEDIFLSFFTKIIKAQGWIKENLFPILSNGNNSKCVGMTLHMSRPHRSPLYLVNKGSPMMRSSGYFGTFAYEIDPTMVSAIHLSELYREGLFDQDLLDEMNDFEVFGQEAINRKAKLLFDNIAKLPHGKHYYMRKSFTGTFS